MRHISWSSGVAPHMSASVRVWVPICGMPTDSGWVAAYFSFGMVPGLTATSSTLVSGWPVWRSSTKIWPALVPTTSAGVVVPSWRGKSISVGAMGMSKSHRSLRTVW